MNQREAFFTIGRYLLLVILSIFNLALFYMLFTPLTLYPSFFIIHLFKPAAYLISQSATMQIGNNSIQLVNACIAGSAYYLLLILNLTTPMSLKTRIKSIFFLFGSFLILNVLRIVVFAFLFLGGYSAFDVAHKLVWYFGSTVMLLVVWFANVRFLNILSIPLYTDIKTLLDDIKHKNQPKLLRVR